MWGYIKSHIISIPQKTIKKIRTNRIAVLLLSAKVIMIVGLFMYGFKCIEQLDMDNILIPIWIAVLAFLLIFSNKIHAYLAKKEIYEPHVILAAVTPFGCFYVIEKINNVSLDIMTWQLVVGNILILLFVFLLFYINLPYKRAAIGVYWTVFFVYALANYYVTKFRGSPIVPDDILSIGTAMRVADGYSFDITENIFIMSLNYFTILIMLLVFPIKKFAFRWKYMLLKLLLSIVVAINISNIRVEEVFGFKVTDEMWNIASAYRAHGCVLSFVAMSQNLAVEAPETYQRQTVEVILSGYQEYTDADNPVKPTIITIMSESFCDLKSLADFYTSDEYLHNWYNVDDYIYRGNLYVSTYGGNTVITEYEFLTGNSISNLPPSIPYQIYNMKNVGNIADILNLNGYLTTAVHPASKHNWNRAKAYERFGFSSFWDIEAFQDAEFFRGKTTDKADLDKVIEVYESNNEPQFIFNITYQNHGGYDIADLEGMDIVELYDQSHEYSDVETYLTLIRESDKAIAEFIDYFRTVDEPVIICIFGDHWPSLNREWLEQVIGKPSNSFTLEDNQRLRAVPYMIWANYEIEIPQQTLNTSANYLGALLLDVSGVSTSTYIEYLLDVRKNVPAINQWGYMTNDGIWHSFEETTDVSRWIDDYKMLTYNAMFDSSRNMAYYRP